VFDEDHVLGAGKPDIEEHKAKGDLVLNRFLDEVAAILVLGNRAAPLLFTRLFVQLVLGFGNQLKAHRQTHPLAVIQGGDEVDAFDLLAGGMVIVAWS